MNGLGFGSTEFHVLRSTEAVLPEFVYHFIRQESYRKAAEDEMTGSVGQKRVPQSFLEATEVPLPPLSEQIRIVTRLTELLTALKTSHEHLSQVQAIIKRFRQAVLTAACSGRLTEDWRGEHPEVETASHLLNRIEECRQRKSNYRLRRSEFLTKDVEEQGSRLTDLPESWACCRVDQIATVGLGGTPPRKESRYWGGDIAWVSSSEVANCRVSATREHITAEGLANSNAKVYPSNTVLIAMIGEGKTRGQSAILDIDASTNQNVAGLIFDGGNVCPDYIWYWALGEYEQNRAVGRGGAQPALNGQKVRALLLPLPPLEEQIVIVGRVKALLERADAVEKRVSAVKSCSDKLTQSMLAKAFRGELVPTEAELARREGREYEHASVLLERIRKERESDTVSKSNGKPKRPKMKLATAKRLNIG